MDDTRVREAEQRLRRVLEDCESVCIGYSGGVDSVFLAAFAVDVLGADRVLAVTGRSAAYPAVQHRMALECVARFGIPHLEIETHELEDPDYAANPTNRCYFCKSELWSQLDGVARARGLRTVVDGSNADDASDHRPGARAARERSVRSPLQEAGLDKAMIRVLSRSMGLPTWDQPASPCLSSRLTYGLAVTPERLSQVERAEALLRERGLRELRVRHHGAAARVEVAPGELAAAAGVVSELAPALARLGFGRVLFDVEGYRRGALNEGLVQLGAGAGVGRERGSGPVPGEWAADRKADPVPEREAEREAARTVDPVVAVRDVLEAGGIRAEVSVVGMDGEIAAIGGGRKLCGPLARLAPEIRSLGFRYVAWEPNGAYNENEVS